MYQPPYTGQPSQGYNPPSNPGYPPPQPSYAPPPMSPQQSYTPPPQMPPQGEVPKKPRRISGLAWVLIVVAFLVGIGVGRAGSGSTTTTTTADTTNTTSQSTPAVTQAPTKPPAPKTWKTTHTYTGNGTKKTETITVPDDWKLQWSCDPASFGGTQYNVMVAVTNSDGTPLDPLAVNTLCSASNKGGETEEHQGGQVYFEVNSEAAWTLTIQELK